MKNWGWKNSHGAVIPFPEQKDGELEEDRFYCIKKISKEE